MEAPAHVDGPVYLLDQVDGQWRWFLRSPNGRLIAQGEPTTYAKACRELAAHQEGSKGDPQ